VRKARALCFAVKLDLYKGKAYTFYIMEEEISHLLMRPMGFPIALWKPSASSAACYWFQKDCSRVTPREGMTDDANQDLE
jgi:hypothetical protein